VFLSRHEKRRNTKVRYDSDDDDSNSDNDGNKNDSYSRRGKRENRRVRYDSDDDSNDDNKSNKKDKRQTIKKRQRSRSLSPSPRKRYTRHDSSSDSEYHSKDRKGKHHSSKKNKNEMKMSSGHQAGLQSSSQFKIKEQEIQRKKKMMKEKEKHNQGETLYRNEHGKRVTETEHHQQARKEVVDVEMDLNTGKIQKQRNEDLYHERELLKQGTFARSINDADQYRKDIIRKGDPMAAAAAASRKGGNITLKKVYKGPQPKPNRFGIQPGYRWDGIDRGNGFEDQVLAMLYGKGWKKEKMYQYSCSDM
jgi:pre-mRNA-splicing factor CWC26